MIVYSKAYKEKYGLSKDELLHVNGEIHLFQSIFDMSYDLDGLSIDDGLDEIERYLKEGNSSD
jgi:hypothetical protein